MSFIGSSISVSPTITGIAATEIKNGAGKAVKFDENGKIVLCSVEGETALGIIILQTSDVIHAGESMTIQIVGNGAAFVGADVKAGAELMVNANGQLVTATASKFIVGYALESVTANGIAKVQICKSGYKAV